MEINITPEEALSLLERAVAEKGDGYVYEKVSVGCDGYCEADCTEDHGGNCVYFDDQGEPSCILGHAFSYLGMTADDFRRVNREAVLDTATFQFSNVLARNIFSAAQRAQDGFGALDPVDDPKPWGEALVAAKEVYTREVGQ